ncbi:hypothetical protein CRG98_049978, partial [Punica granatum]
MVFDRLNKNAAKWLNDIPADRWSRSTFDAVCKNQAVTSNMCEQFNGAILKYRGKPIITMFKGKAIYRTPHWSGDPNRANLRSWELSGIACEYALACISHNSEKTEQFVHYWLTKETNDKIYSNYINPAAGEGFWEKTGFDSIQPPIEKRKPGKPKTKRKK